MSAMQLERIFLEKIDFKLNKRDAGGIAETSFNLSVTAKYDKENRRALVSVSVSIPAEQTSHEQLFKLEVAFSGIFKFDENFPEEKITSFQQVNCPAILFPYLRETVADIVRRADLPSLHLPPFNFVNMYEKTEEKQKKKLLDKNTKK